MILGTNHSDTISIKIGGTNALESNHETLRGAIINNSLTFEEHISKLCQKVSYKLYALSGISYFMDENKLKVLMKALKTL